MGVRYKGYCSDITRTVYLGKPKPKEIEEYNFLLDIQEKALDYIFPGIKACDLDSYVRKMFGEKNKFFIHIKDLGRLF